MIRTNISLDSSLDSDDKIWLERKAKAAGVPMTELVREAIRSMRRQDEMSFEQLLEQTVVLGRKKTGLPTRIACVRSGGEGLAARLRREERWRLPDAFQAACRNYAS